MPDGPTILHLFDPRASAHEAGALHHEDAIGIARASRAVVAPECLHVGVTLPGRSLADAALALRRVDRPGGALHRRASDGRSLLHCYSWRAARAARLAFGRRHPILLSVGEESGVARSRLGVSDPDRVLRHGVEPSDAIVPLCAGEPSASLAPVRDSIRSALGIGEREFVVGALSEPGGATNARWLVFFAGILVAGGLDLTILVPRCRDQEASQIARMRRFHATTRLNLRVIIVQDGCGVGPENDASAWHACDAAVLRPDPWARTTSSAAASRAIRRSHASGVPVIAPRELMAAGLRPAAVAEHLAVSAGTTKQVARALSALIDNRALLERVREDARRASLACADRAAFVGAVGGAYRPATRGLFTRAAERESVA